MTSYLLIITIERIYIMDKANIDRINQLSRLARERELTEEEQAERARRREAYLKAFRGRFKQQLDNTVFDYSDGSSLELKSRRKR